MPLCWVCYPPLTSGSVTVPAWTTSTTTSSATTWTISNCTVGPTTYPIRTATITWVDPYQGMWLEETEHNTAIRRAYEVERWRDEVDGQIDDLQRDLRWVEPQQRLARPHVRRNAEEVARRDAEEKARELLLANLTPDQRASLQRDKWFVVEGKSGQRYRIRDAGHLVANIDVIDAQPRRIERVLHRLCGHIGEYNIPLSDHLLAQKLMLEADEDAFLRIANRHLG